VQRIAELERLKAEAIVGIYRIATLGKQRLNVIGNLHGIK
jgi:hypothetical protein